MTKEKYMALADFQTLWTNTLKPYIVGGFIAITAVAEGATPKLVLQNGTLIEQSTFQPAGSYVLASEKGAASGVATLDANGFVPSSQLPSFVDDVIEAANFAALPATGEGGKIYVTLDDNKTYRWGGSAYTEISASIALGETAGTAYEGSKGKALKDAYDAHAANTDIHVTAQKQSDWDAKYDLPTGGIPKTDLASAVGASLDLADSAYQLPTNGIPATDLAQGVQDALTAAGTAYQKPSTGIPASDMTQAVQDSLGLANTAVQDANYVHTDSNYTAAEKTKLGNIDAGAQVNVIETVKVNGTALTPDANKAVNVEFEIPERVTASDLATFVV